MSRRDTPESLSRFLVTTLDPAFQALRIPLLRARLNGIPTPPAEYVRLTS
jgi:hypothetical protein